jgi:O-antigen ligase
LLSHKPWKRTPLDVPLLIFVGIGVLSAIINRVPPLVAAMGLRILLRYVLLFYLVIQIGFSRRATRRLIIAMLGGALLVMGVGLAQAIIGPRLTDILRMREARIGVQTVQTTSGVFEAKGRFIFSTLGRYDALGMYGVVILLLVLALYTYYPRWRGILRWLILATGICLALTMSRQSWLALYAALWSWGLLSKKKKRAVGLLLVLALIPAVLIGTAHLMPSLVRSFSPQTLNQASVLTRMLAVFSPEYLQTSAYRAGRLYVLRHVGERIMQLAPLLGFGPGRLGSLTADFFGFSTAELLGMEEWQVYLVNDVNWITILGQFGLIGTLAFLMMFVTLGRYAWRMYNHMYDPLARSMALACVGGIVAFLMLGFFGPNFEQRVVSMYVWLTAGLTVALARVGQRAGVEDSAHKPQTSCC